MSQLTRLRVMDALQPGREYTFNDIARSVDFPEPEIRAAIHRLWRNKALRILRRRPYTYARANA